jgi:hypothetical protein
VDLLKNYKLTIVGSYKQIGRKFHPSSAARMEDKRNAYRILVGKSEGKRPRGRPRCRWVDNIKLDLRYTGLGGMDWIHLA